MLNIILMLSGNTIALIAVLTIAFVLVFFALKGRKKKIIKPEIIKEIKAPPGLGDYDFKHEPGEWD